MDWSVFVKEVGRIIRPRVTVGVRLSGTLLSLANVKNSFVSVLRLRGFISAMDAEALVDFQTGIFNMGCSEAAWRISGPTNPSVMWLHMQTIIE